MEFRVGHGIDIHRLVEGRKLILGGIEVPHERGLLGHSDADVLTHAIIDAILGAAGQGDIGTFFPDSDAKWKDADSMQLLSLAYSRVRGLGWRVVNIDCNILAEAPKLSPHISSMKQRIASALDLHCEAVGIKAGTAEGLGPIGRSEGMAAHATVLLGR
ncbi:MAG: 2-C-methyl-D-erythritol 2,4-cyclodiphosphate synthase [Deltaproteobacteria bacterium]|nr:2-C-methyl-D-erythritol 2,4-cyclodiphosphate synthase [Deltaproteobacteria bacterium]